MKEITVGATIENLPVVLDFLDAELDAVNCDVKNKSKISVAVDEIFSNIANYAYELTSGKATIKIESDKDNHQIEVTFIDSGKPYNPLEKEDPNTHLPLEERNIGGLGIFIVKKSYV